MSDTIVRTEIRCPTGSNSLLLKVLSKGKPDLKARDTDLLELYCKECSRDLKRLTPEGGEVQRVLHIMKPDGDFVQTEIQFKGERDSKTIDFNTQVELFKLSRSFLRGAI